MMKSDLVATSARERTLSALLAVIAGGALILQLVLLLSLTRDSIGPLLATIRYFSYFTILSNIVVALVGAWVAFGAAARVESAFAVRLRGAAALYIAVTGGIYVTVLQGLWQPQGAQWLADVSLHYVVPALYLLLWLLFSPKGRLRWSDALRWLVFPLAYLLWALWRGSWAHEYPYPFVDVAALGMAKVLRNCVAVSILFVLLGLGLVAIDRALGRGPTLK